MKQLQDSQAVDMGSGLETASQKSLTGTSKSSMYIRINQPWWRYLTYGMGKNIPLFP